jgi:hypothetical protein
MDLRCMHAPTAKDLFDPFIRVFLAVEITDELLMLFQNAGRHTRAKLYGEV